MSIRTLLATTATVLSLGLAGTQSAQALDLSAMTEAERDAFRAEVRAYLLDHPEVLIEAIGILEARQAAEQAQGEAALVAANLDALHNDGYSWVGGNPDGDITVVEFLDYRCSFCKRAHPEVAELIRSDGNIRLIVKEYPILGEASVLASRFALAVKTLEGDDAYAETNDALMTMRAEVTEESLRGLSDRSGYDTDAIMAEMDSEEITARIAANHALAQTLQINGTPSFVFGEQMVRGYAPLDVMREIVAEERGG